MKMKNFMAMMMAACVMVMGAASCDDDDELSGDEKAAQEMAGTYTGEYISTVMTYIDTTTVEMIINKLGSDSIQLVTPTVGSGTMAMPSLTLNLKAVNTEGVYSATAESVSGSIIVDNVEKAYTFSNVAIVVTKNKAGISYTIRYGKMPFDNVVTFKGEK